MDDHSAFNTDNDVSSALVCNPEKYLARLKDQDMSEEDKIELIHTLWNILVMVSDLPLDFDPIAALFGSDEDKIAEEFAPTSSDPVNLEHNPEPQLTSAAGSDPAAPEES